MLCYLTRSHRQLCIILSDKIDKSYFLPIKASDIKPDGDKLCNKKSYPISHLLNVHFVSNDLEKLPWNNNHSQIFWSISILHKGIKIILILFEFQKEEKNTFRTQIQIGLPYEEINIWYIRNCFNVAMATMYT